MKLYLSAALALVFAALPASTFAQAEQGRIAGIVRDSEQRVRARTRRCRSRTSKTGEERTAVTNGQGYFLIGSLKPSTYTIKVEKAGFATIEYTAMPVAARPGADARLRAQAGRRAGSR